MVTIISAGGWEGARAILASGDKFIALTAQLSGTTAITVHDGTTNYQVPAGKTYTLLGMFVSQIDAAKTLTIFQNDTADTTDGSDVDKFALALPAGIDINALNFMPISGTIAASKFLNADASSAAGTEPFITIIGAEG